MCAHNGLGIHKIRLESQHFLVVVASGQGVPQGGEPGVLNQGEVSGAQSLGGPAGIERLNVIGICLEAFF